jgi:recombination associated protein RdgC
LLPGALVFKSLTAYHLPAASHPDAQRLDEQLAALPFKPCGPTEALSYGFVPPRGAQHAALVEWVNGNGLLKLQFEQRLLPGSVVRERVDALAQQIEQESGRKPGAKRRRELKDEALLDLLPQAFTRQTSVRMWLAPSLELLVVDATASARLDAALTALSKVVPGFQVQPLQTAESPAVCMKAWLLDGVAPAGFGIGREAELRSSDVQAATVRYTRHGLEGDDIRQHLASGKEVRKLALNWKDRLDLVLADNGQLSKIKFDDGVFEQDGAEHSEQDPFDADAFLLTKELSELLPALFDGLGGRVSLAEAAAAQPAPARDAPAPGLEPAPWDA